MTSVKPVVWAEGIFLSQQHLQQYDQYIHHTLSTHIHSLSPYAYGLTKLVIDETALEHGIFRVLEIEAIFQDKRIVAYKNSFEDKLSLDLKTYQKNQMMIALALPRNQFISDISGYDKKHPQAAYQADYREVHDLYDEERKQEVLFAKENIQLIVEDDPHNLNHLNKIMIAEVIAKTDQSYKLNSQFIPQIFWGGASENFMQSIQKISEIMQAKLNLLSQAYKKRATAFITQDVQVSELLSMYTLAKYLPVVKSMLFNPKQPPIKYYEILQQLITSLTILNPNYEIRDFPFVSHNLTATFKPMIQTLYKILEDVLIKPEVKLQLNKHSDTIFNVSDINSQLLESSEFYLGVKFFNENKNWATILENQIKIASKETIEEVAAMGLPGLSIQYVPRPPVHLISKPGYEYFHLKKSGMYWEAIKEKKNFSLFLPTYFAHAELELTLIENKS